MRDRFTRVLKGHIAIACAVFPEGASGAQLDPLARVALGAGRARFRPRHQAMASAGYLSVYGGPQRISQAGHAVPLKRGMIVSNEPGYYKTDSLRHPH